MARHNYLYNLTPEEIKQKIDKAGSVKDFAEHENITVDSVKTLCARKGIKLGKRETKLLGKDAEVKQMLDNGYTYSDIAKKFGCISQNVQNFVQTRGWVKPNPIRCLDKPKAKYVGNLNEKGISLLATAVIKSCINDIKENHRYAEDAEDFLMDTNRSDLYMELANRYTDVSSVVRHYCPYRQ